MARILYYGDTPTATTGLAKVTRNMVHGLLGAGHAVDVLGIGYWGFPYDREQLPYLIYPAYVPDPRDQDYRGRKTLLNFLQTQDDYDVCIVNIDHFWMALPNPATNRTWAEDIVAAARKTKTRIVHYTPVDGRVMPSWLTLPRLADVPMPYTDFGVQEFARFDKNLSGKCLTAGHGIDFGLYRPDLPKSEVEGIRKQLLPKGKTRLGLAVAANNTRKDWPRTLQVLREVLRREPGFCLVCWTDFKGRTDISENIPALLAGLDLTSDFDAVFPDRDNQPEEMMPLVYAAADLHLSTTTGEGWGFSAFEAMAVGTPNVIPRVAAWEMIPEDCCLPIRAGDTPDLNRVFPMVSPIPRPICSVVDAAEKVLSLLDSPCLGRNLSQAGQEWVRQFTWEKARADLLKGVDRALALR